MCSQPIPGISELIAARTGEEMALNDRYLNPQMGRILRTLGFDRTWICSAATAYSRSGATIRRRSRRSRKSWRCAPATCPS
jgi:hypothetical protein